MRAGRETETSSAVGEIHVEICSHCHPFFTGRQKLVDTAGRVERFIAKYGDGSSRAAERVEQEEEPRRNSGGGWLSRRRPALHTAFQVTGFLGDPVFM